MLSIVKRQSVYYFRIRIPVDVRKHFPGGEIMKSLHTRLYRQAKSLARSKLGELEKVIMTIRSGVLSDEEIIRLVENYKQAELPKRDSLLDVYTVRGDLGKMRPLLMQNHTECA